MGIELNKYQLTELLEIASMSDEEEGDNICILEGDGHSGKGLYAYWVECPEEGAMYIPVDEEDNQRVIAADEAFEAEL